MGRTARARLGRLVVAAVVCAGCSADAARPDATPAGAASPLAAAAPTSAPSPDRSAFVAAVDALANDALRRGPIAGLSVAVVQGGRPIVARGYGFADAEAGRPADENTSYPIASVSKRFTAAAILRLADQGVVSLDDPLSRFFPNARARIGALTLRHLLNHTSGITKGGPAPREATLSVVRRGGTLRDQGEMWDYSNYNFSLLGLVIEQATGRRYADYVRDELAAPLGLRGTGYCEDGTPVPGRARDYLSTPTTVVPTEYWAGARFFAAGGLCSTVMDLVRWEQALQGGRVVSPARLQEMNTPTALPDDLEADYGFGTRRGLLASHRKLGHTGGGQGNKAVVADYPDDDLTIVVLMNTERAGASVPATDIEDRIGRLFFETGDAATPATATPPAELARYAGRYREGSGRLITVEVKDALHWRGDRRRPAGALVAEGGDVFRDAEDPSDALRFQQKNGTVRGYARYHNGWFAALGVRLEGDR